MARGDNEAGFQWYPYSYLCGHLLRRCSFLTSKLGELTPAHKKSSCEEGAILRASFSYLSFKAPGRCCVVACMQARQSPAFQWSHGA